ncbi:exodeoxyribonuclease V subunit gamma [Psittacicella hinzii]|nr:exodeoxyribonuclease V subunit gamma [Psittacicella hinzii]
MIKNEPADKVQLDNLPSLVKQFKSRDYIVTTYQLQKLQVEHKLKELAGVQVQPKFINMGGLTSELINDFYSNLNQGYIKLLAPSPSLAHRLPADLISGKYSFVHINERDMRSKDDILLWAIIAELNQQIRQDPQTITNVFISEVISQLKEEIAFNQETDLNTSLYFIAKKLLQTIVTLDNNFHDVYSRFLAPDFDLKQFMLEYVTEVEQENVILAGQIAFMREVCLQNMQLLSNPYFKDNKIKFNSWEALTFIIEGEFELVKPFTQESKRFFLLDLKVFHSREILLLKKAAKFCNFDIVYFLNAATPLLFDTQSRRNFLQKCKENGNEFYRSLSDFNLPYRYVSSEASFNLLSLLGNSLKKITYAFPLDDSIYQTLEEQKLQLSDQIHYPQHLALNSLDNYAEYSIFIDPALAKTADGFYSPALYQQLTSLYSQLYTQVAAKVTTENNEESFNQLLVQELQTAEANQLLLAMQEAYATEPAPTLLQQIQKSIFEYTPFESETTPDLRASEQPVRLYHLRGDDSFTLVKTHSKRRELEYVINFIQRELDLHGDSLTLDDFAIVAPNIEDYRGLIEELVTQFRWQIAEEANLDPKLTTFIEFILNLNNNYLELQAFEQWISFAQVRQFYQIEDSEDFGFYRQLFNRHQVTNEVGYNFDHKDNHILPLHSQLNDAFTKSSIKNKQDERIPLFNYNSWQHVFFRANINNSFSHGDDLSLYLTTDLAALQTGQNYTNLSKFNSILHDLINYCQFVNQKHSVKAWINFFNNLRLQFFKDDQEINLQFQQILIKFAKLQQKISRKFNQADQVEIEQYVVDKTVWHNLLFYSETQQNNIELFTNSLHFASLKQIAGSSFKYVICMGLTARNFPEKVPANPYDIANFLQVETNIPSAYQRAQHTFLELLTNTKQKLLLTYVGKNSKDQDLLASSIVSDVLEFIRPKLALPKQLLADYPELDLLKTALLKIFYSDPQNPSFIKDLSLGSFARENYGIEQLNLAQNFDEQLAQKILASSAPSYNHAWVEKKGARQQIIAQVPQAESQSLNKQEAGEQSKTTSSQGQLHSSQEQAYSSQGKANSVYGQENQQELLDFGNFQGVLEFYQKVLALASQDPLTVVEAEPDLAKDKVIEISFKDLQTFFTSVYQGASNDPDGRISKFQRLFEYSQELDKNTTYGLADSSQVAGYVYGNVFKLLTAGESLNDFIAKEYLNGGEFRSSLNENKKDQDYIQEIRALEQAVKGKKGIYNLLALDVNKMPSYSQAVELDLTKITEATSYVYLKLSDEFCQNYLALMRQAEQELDFAVSSQFLYQQLVKALEEQAVSGQERSIFLKLAIDYSLLNGDTLVYTRRDLDFTDKLSLKREYRKKVFNSFKDIFSLYVGVKNPQVKQVQITYLVRLKAIQSFEKSYKKLLDEVGELPDTVSCLKKLMLKQANAFFYNFDLQQINGEQKAEVMQGCQKIFTSLIAPYILGKDLLLPLFKSDASGAESFLALLFKQHFEQLDDKEIEILVNTFVEETNLKPFVRKSIPSKSDLEIDLALERIQAVFAIDDYKEVKLPSKAKKAKA